MPKHKTGDDVNPSEVEQSATTEDVDSGTSESDQDEQARPEAAENIDEPQASDEEAGDEAGDEAGNGADSGDEDADSEDSSRALKEAVAALEKDLAEARDQVLRVRAEEENTRRRAARDTENARKFALEKFAGELLPVIDNFERALDDATEDSAVHEGLDLSMKLLFGVLEKTGIEVVNPIGEPFDPRFHEAIATVDKPDAQPGSVTEVVQKGYVLNGRLLRAAMVLVAKRNPDKG